MSISQNREYSIPELMQEMESLRKFYQLVRLVDAEECRTINLGPDQRMTYGEECHDIWNTRERCPECSSYHASQTRSIHYKTEYYQKKRYEITSIPIYLRMNGQELIPCVLEAINASDFPDDSMIPDTIQGDTDYYRTHDTLTGLYNQSEAFRLIRKRLMEEPEKEFLLISSDIRAFHMVNVLFGRETGNAVLIGIADLMKKHFTHGEILSRTHGDRFLLLIEKEHFHPDDVKERLGTLQNLINSPVYTLKIHIGVYEVRDINIPLSIMLQRTEIALATLRDSHGISIAWYTEGMMEQQVEDQWIIAEFQRSLMTTQFQVYYQPQVDMHGTILGAEALVRWIRNDGIMVPLERFLPVLSRSDLITRMDEHVWEMVVRQLAAWRGTELENLYISINIEPKDFLYVNVPDKLTALCERYRVPVRNLHVEITERALSGSDIFPPELIQSLQERGFIVEIDDFGKGSSSLARLKDIPADVLKIDMEFLRASEESGRSRIILESVVRMAGELDTEVIVEGVETDYQKQNLQNMGCRVYQGFLFSRPVPVEDFEKLCFRMLEEKHALQANHA